MTSSPPPTYYKPSLLLSILDVQSSIKDTLDFGGCLTFIELVQLLKSQISLNLRPEDDSGPPESLQESTHQFLCKCLGLTRDDMKVVWHALSKLAWDFDVDTNDLYIFGQRQLRFFLDYGLPFGISFYHFAPPISHCLDPQCTKKAGNGKESLAPRPLVETLTMSVTVFTLDHGPVPGNSTSKYCRECNTRYYPNYWVNNAESTRTYYSGPFRFLHVAEAVYIDSRTLELFTTMMLTSWTSASNCARIYNDGIANKSLASSLPAGYSKSFVLNSEDVWNSLFLFWLLEDAEEREEVLQLIHEAHNQAQRLIPALQRRNLRMAGPGQEAWNHACDLCCWYNEEDNGTETFLRSVVTDGVTIGRPTCSVHDCSIPLESVKHRYCPTHTDQDLLCVVTTCSALAEEGHRTCSIKDHRELENFNATQNKAMFQLKLRLSRLKTSQPNEAIPEVPDINNPDSSALPLFGDEDVLIDSTGICEGKPEEGNKTLRARFGRRRTHNEELCVASCGVILGRATFYGSEAPNGVCTFWKTLFPTRRSLPGCLWHDNNCRILAMLETENDTYFSASALPVDVFHFKCKHKATDDQCNANCNPALWPELYTSDGKWRFNSSAAEQANAWIGGYQSIVREMQADRYEFFLDELIKRRNRNIIRDLEKKDKNPHLIPREELLRADSPEIVP